MSVTGVFTKGRPAGHPGATAILKYIPRPRVPWQPSRFGRANLDEADLASLWGRGRYRTGPGNYNSGYSLDKTHTLEDNAISIIPKHELEKYMPDISIGSKALVTPVSLMSARNGHRVTHDMVHSYDPYIGRVQKPATVDHDNITPDDPNRVGLNAATLDCRGRIYRWLRRGPFAQEDQYFRRSTQLSREGTLPVSAHEAPLMKKIVRLANRGHLKAACEEYRRITTVPPVAVYRTLTAACVAGAKLADAVAIFEDGDTKLFYVARDGEVLFNLMRCAIAAKHRVRVMWVHNIMRGRHYENTIVRAEVDPIWRYRITALALEFLLDQNATEEARVLYAYLEEAQLQDCDVQVRIGQIMQDALAKGNTIRLDADVFKAMGVVKSAEAVAPQVALAVYDRYQVSLADGGASWSTRGLLSDPSKTAAGKDGAAAMTWLAQHFSDLHPATVLRLARFQHGTKDLMAKQRGAYVERAASWLEQLSTVHQVREEVPLTYLRKSKPSATSENVRVAWNPQRRAPTDLLANEEGFQFFFQRDGKPTRMVEETFVYAGDSLHGRYLAQQPHHTEVASAMSFLPEQTKRTDDAAVMAGSLAGGRRGSDEGHAIISPAAPARRQLHASVTNELRRGAGVRSSAGTAARPTGGDGVASSTAEARPAETLSRQTSPAPNSNDANLF